MSRIQSSQPPWTFREFIEPAWEFIEPATPFVGGYHVSAIAEHLQAISDGQLRNLIINMPPRHSKSSLVGVLWPAWEWTVNPWLQWLFASYREALSIRDSVKMRRLITSSWYQEQWGGVYRLTGDQNEKRRFENDKNGHRVSIGVGTGTGEGGHRLVCLGYNSLITTSAGRLPIGQIVERKMPVKVLSFDHGAGRACWGSIEAHESGPGRPSVRLRFSDGSTLDATDDHPIYVAGQGYVLAAQVSPGERVVTDRAAMRGLWQGRAPLAGSHGEAGGPSGVLQPRLSRHRADRREQPVMGWRQGPDHLRPMRAAAFDEAQSSAQGVGPFLWTGLQGRVRSPASASVSRSASAVLVLRGDHQDHRAHGGQAEVLLADVRQPLPLGAHQGAGQPTLSAWACGEQVPGRVPPTETRDPEARRLPVSGLRDDDGAARVGVAGPSYRLRADTQRRVESDNAVQVVSRQDAWPTGESGSVAETTVVAVERIPQPERVYNLCIAEHHNYFAAGILVHNCDDPLSADQAESVAYREAANDWVDGTFSTRGNDPRTVARVIVMQRLHEEDTTGHLLEKMKDGGTPFDHLVLPAEYEPTVQICLADLQHDPRTEPGEPLSPERYGPEQLAQLKIDLKTPQRVAGQLQQRPSPAVGNVFQRAWWQARNRYDAIDDALKHKAYGRWIFLDTAYKDKDTSDFTACSVLDLAPDYRVAWRHVWNERLEFPGLLARIEETAQSFNADGKLRGVIIEDKGSGTSAAQSLKMGAPGWLGALITPFTPNGSKVYRAQQASLWCSLDCVLIPEPSEAVPWLFDATEQLFKFPTAAHDDIVDSFSMGIIYLEPYISTGHAIRTGRPAA